MGSKGLSDFVITDISTNLDFYSSNIFLLLCITIKVVVYSYLINKQQYKMSYNTTMATDNIFFIYLFLTYIACIDNSYYVFILKLNLSKCVHNCLEIVILIKVSIGSWILIKSVVLESSVKPTLKVCTHRKRDEFWRWDKYETAGNIKSMQSYWTIHTKSVYR